MRLYKANAKYHPAWKAKWPWMEYDEHNGGMFCTFCKKYSKPPVVARGAWVTCPINNWVKATELINKYLERMLAATEVEWKRNRELMKKLIWSLYFLV